MAREFTKVCAENEIEEGGIKTISLEGRPLALAKYEGHIYAIDDICTHDGGDLGEGDVVKGQIQCPRHGARFDLKTGQVTRMPAVIGIGTYEVKIDNGFIYVAIPVEG
jgi:3-phenylpropionate/trans-cinnamate dioxygenase ferredoxin subunit